MLRLDGGEQAFGGHRPLISLDNTAQDDHGKPFGDVLASKSQKTFDRPRRTALLCGAERRDICASQRGIPRAGGISDTQDGVCCSNGIGTGVNMFSSAGRAP